MTPNDAFLTTNYHDPSLLLSDKAQALYAATLSGAFHIIALGHAAVADSQLVEVRKSRGVYVTAERPPGSPASARWRTELTALSKRLELLTPDS